jgi:glucokinase
MNHSIVAGVDIGGSHITAALVNLNTRQIIPGSEVRRRVNSHGSAGEIITAWSEAIREAFSHHPDASRKIGIAMPGAFDYPNGISLIQNQDKYDALYGLNVKELLARQLQIQPGDIRLMNDAGCFLRGEVFGGAARGYSDAIGLTLGTGLGSARYHRGVAEDAALWCAPFRDGITEDYLSTRWFIQRYKELSNQPVKDVKELAGLVRTDLQAQQVFREFADTLSTNKDVMSDELQ